jgi:PKD repeat protein
LMTFLMFTTQSWALSVNITSPASGTVFPSTQSNVTLQGSVSEAPNGTGTVVCTGNKVANFSSQTSTNWFRGWPLSNGLNTVTCVYTKGTQTASATVSFTRQVVVTPPANQAPNAVLGATPLTGPAPHNVAFASGSYDSDGTIASYLWTYGDGTTSTTNSNHYKLYSQPGTYTATLKVTDNNGAFAEATKTIVVTTSTSSTLLGPDTDNDGVRDDVQAWINTTYSSQPTIKNAAIEYAKAIQNGFANKDNVANSIAATHVKLDAATCLNETVLESGIPLSQATDVSKKLQLLHTNTKERILAAQKISKNFSGNSFEIKSKSEACGSKNGAKK